MSNKITFILISFVLFSCKNNSEVEKTDNSVVTEISKENTDSEINRKLIEICKNMDGVIDADILDDKLTIRANISKSEGQKLSDGMLKEIRKHNPNINTVIVFDLGFDLVGHSGNK
nr:hypothetical protein [uncultured Flavobacterium sp.]